MTPSSTPISFWNYVNLLTYFVNAAIVYSVGLYGALGKGNNAVISAKYQTLITPARFTFVIWAVIYLCQLVWAVSQVVSPQYRVKALQYVHNYNYVLVCIAQMAWTFAFGLQVLWLSLVFMVLTLILLMRLIYQARTVQSQQDESGWSDYFLYQFPFTIHAGWIIAAALVNANVVLVVYHDNRNVQVFAALLSLALVLMAATFFLSLPDFIIPLVLIWALSGIYNELGTPHDSIRTKFTDQTVEMVQMAAATTIFVVAIALFLRFYTSWTESRHPSPSAESNTRLNEPLISTQATTAKQENIAAKT